MAAEETQEVSVRDSGDVLFAEPAILEEFGHASEVSDCVEILRGLLGAVCAIEVAAKPDMPRIACDLAVVINVIDEVLERYAGASRRRLPTNPARHQHPRIQRDADDRIAFDQCPHHFITQMPIVGHQRSRVVMACPDGAFEEFE